MFSLLNRSVQNIPTGTASSHVHVPPLLTKINYFLIISLCMTNELHFVGCSHPETFYKIDLSFMFYIFNNSES